MVANAVKTLLGPDAFRGSKGPSARKATLNAALFDAEMVGVGRYLIRNPARRIGATERFNSEFGRLMNDNAFVRAISASTSDEQLVNHRLDEFEALMERCFSD